MIINFKDIVEKYNIDIKIVRDFFNELAEHYELFSEKKMEEESFEFQAANNKDYKQILDLGLSYTNDMVTVNASLVPYLLDNGCSINGLLDVGIRTLNVELIEAVIDSSKRDIHADRLERIYMIGKYLKNQKLIDFVNINNPLFIKLVNVNNPLLSMELASIDDTSLIGLDLAIKNHDKLVLSLGIKNNDRKLMEDALKHIDKIDTLNEIPFNIPVDILEKIMDKGLEPKKALNILCKNTTESEEQISNKIKLLNIIFKHAPSISSLGEWYYTSLDELKLLKKYPSIEIIKYISNMSQDLRNNTHLMNEIGITKEELTKIHEQFIEELLSAQNNLLDKFSFLDCAMKRSVPIFELIAKQLSSAEKSLYNPDLRIYVKILILCNFRDLVNCLHPIMICKNDKITEYLRAEGSNLTTVELITKYNKLVENYISTINGSKDLMNKKITNLLKGEVNFADLNDISEEENDTGFSIIELVTLSGNFDLLVNILKANEYNDNLSNQVMTILSNFPNLNKDKKEIKKLFESVLKNMNIDQVLNNGESLTDILINLDEYRDQILKKTKDPLFYFMKEDANLISLDSKLVHIAISNDDGLWSTGVWSLARLLSKKFSNIGFHLVNQEILEKGGEDFAKQFSGWIIPGAMDNYPKKEFSKKDYEPKSPIEKLYQRVLKVVDEFSIPLLGMCAGAQHLTIYKGGTVAPVDKKYFSGKNQIDIVDGTMTHFLHLNKEQQENFLKTLELVKISLKGDTAHHFAAKTLKNLELGAVSLDGVPMAFISDDGKMFATQYHPEHRFNSQEPEDAPQIAWIINVIKIIIMHHEDKINGSNNLETYIKLVKDRLDDWFVEHLFDETASLGQDAIHQDAIHN